MLEFSRRLVFICDTLNFSHFTRRATTEAVAAQYENSVAFCSVGILDFLLRRVNKHSSVIKTHYFVRLFSARLLKWKFVLFLNILFNKFFFKSAFGKDDIVVYSTPNQAFLFRYLRRRSVFILSDPYHLMGYEFRDVRTMLENASVIFATSVRLSADYLSLYFGIKRQNVYYWPNCVDLNYWAPAKKTVKGTINSEIILGFAGNFMEVTDIELLDFITTNLPDFKFELAGRVLLQNKKDRKKLFQIFEKPNVAYLGAVDYSKLPGVMSHWSIGIMIDKINELASYHHHNKIYQYLSLGKPVVFQKNVRDYESLYPVATGALDPQHFVALIKEVSGKMQSGYDYFKEAAYAAQKNSSSARAMTFLSMLQS